MSNTNSLSSSCDSSESSDNADVGKIKAQKQHILQATMAKAVASRSHKALPPRGLAGSRPSSKWGRWRKVTKLQTQFVYQWFEAQVEVRSDNLAEARIYMRGLHPDVAEATLQYSKRLRLYLYERASQPGITASRLKIELMHNMDHVADAGATPRLLPRPAYRVPKAKEVGNIVRYLRTAKRMDRDPFVAVEMFQETSPDLVFG
ncbi:hypothetical protein V8E36_000634 [Tilletia maclaganii]